MAIFGKHVLKEIVNISEYYENIKLWFSQLGFRWIGNIIPNILEKSFSLPVIVERIVFVSRYLLNNNGEKIIIIIT